MAVNEPSPRPTLRHVAKAAGLSVTQASRALNDHWDVAETTKAHVRKVASELGYIPNLEARRLKMPNSRAEAIGLVLPQAELRFSDAFFAELLSGIVEEASRAGREVRLTSSLGGADDPEPYRQAVRSRQVDGFILVRTLMEDPRAELLAKMEVPFVTFGRDGDRCDAPFVDDADDSMAAIVDHLVALGHRRIACLAEPRRFAKAWYRLRSFRQAMEANDLPVDEELIAEADFHEDSGYRWTKGFLDRDDRPSAVVAFNDLLAFGALTAARDVGLRVPEDLSVTGFDDIPAARHASPGLTTLRQSASEVGSMLCRQLFDVVDGTDTVERHVLLRPEFVQRGSTGPAAST